MKAPAQSDSNFQMAPAGSHVGYLIRILDLGTTYNEMYSKWQHKACFMYELTSELMEPNDDGEEKPYIISEFMTLSMNEKANLRKRIETWRGEAFENDEEAEQFEITDLLGKPGLVTVIHGKKQNGQDKAVVASVIKMPKGMPAPERVNDLVLLDFENFDKEAFENLSDGMKNIIKESQEYEALFNEGTTNSNKAQQYEADAKADAKSEKQQPPADFDDDIPF